jgi:hypothetical protein
MIARCTRCTPKMMFFPDCSKVIQRAPRVVANALRLVARAPKSFQACSQCSQTCYWRFQMPTGAPEGHCISLAKSGIWLSWKSGRTTLRYSLRPPATNIYYADAILSYSLTESQHIQPGNTLVSLTPSQCFELLTFHTHFKYIFPYMVIQHPHWEPCPCFIVADGDTQVRSMVLQHS